MCRSVYAGCCTTDPFTNTCTRYTTSGRPPSPYSRSTLTLWNTLLSTCYQTSPVLELWSATCSLRGSGCCTWSQTRSTSTAAIIYRSCPRVLNFTITITWRSMSASVSTESWTACTALITDTGFILANLSSKIQIAKSCGDCCFFFFFNLLIYTYLNWLWFGVCIKNGDKSIKEANNKHNWWHCY